nr:hypothetical protein [Candidatus Sigynarchaeota archaeon]
MDFEPEMIPCCDSMAWVERDGNFVCSNCGTPFNDLKCKWINIEEEREREATLINEEIAAAFYEEPSKEEVARCVEIALKRRKYKPTLSQEDLEEVKNFLWFFSLCPVCNEMLNSYVTLAMLYFSTVPEKKKFTKMLLEFIKDKSHPQDLLELDVRPGIPCCNCYDALYDFHANGNETQADLLRLIAKDGNAAKERILRFPFE